MLRGVCGVQTEGSVLKLNSRAARTPTVRSTLPFSPAGLADGLGEGNLPLQVRILRGSLQVHPDYPGSPAARLPPRARLCGSGG